MKGLLLGKRSAISCSSFSCKVIHKVHSDRLVGLCVFHFWPLAHHFSFLHHLEKGIGIESTAGTSMCHVRAILPHCQSHSRHRAGAHQTKWCLQSIAIAAPNGSTGEQDGGFPCSSYRTLPSRRYCCHHFLFFVNLFLWGRGQRSGALGLNQKGNPMHGSPTEFNWSHSQVMCLSV